MTREMDSGREGQEERTFALTYSSVNYLKAGR